MLEFKENSTKKLDEHQTNESSKKSKRTFDRENIPVCNILGVDIAAIDMKWVLNFFVENLEELSGDYICISNVHTTVISYEDSEYCKIQNRGIMALPDGAPLSVIGRKRGYKKMDRVAGPSLMGEVFNISIENKFRHFFYGSTKETLDKLVINLEKSYPGLKIVGIYSPPFRPNTEKEDERIIKEINDTQPDFIWVGLGAPKQEQWMVQHQGKVKGVMIGVGAGFDYYAGNIKRAPRWMQNNSLEWLYRLIQDPKRLFYRYLSTNFKFLKAIVIDKYKVFKKYNKVGK